MTSTSVASVLPGQATVLACWAALAERSPGARMVAAPGATAAVFPAVSYLNNAVLTDLDALGAALPALTARYAEAGIASWAVWVPARSPAFDGFTDRCAAVAGLTRDITTLVMRADIAPDLESDLRVVRASYAAVERLALTEQPLPATELGEPDDIDELAVWALVEDGLAVASAYTYQRGDDCGVYTVGTIPAYRRRGFGRALAAHALADARTRGARTATLQSTPMGESLYRSLGFRAAGRYEEWVFPGVSGNSSHRQ